MFLPRPDRTAECQADATPARLGWVGGVPRRQTGLILQFDTRDGEENAIRWVPFVLGRDQRKMWDNQGYRVGIQLSVNKRLIAGGQGRKGATQGRERYGPHHHPSPKPADERKRERSGQPQGRSLSGQPGGQIQAGGEDNPPPTAQAHHPDCRQEPGFKGRSGVEPLSEVGSVDREPRRIFHPMQSKRDGAGKCQESEEPGSGGELVDHVSACSGSPWPVYSQRARDFATHNGFSTGSIGRALTAGSP